MTMIIMRWVMMKMYKDENVEKLLVFVALLRSKGATRIET